MYVIVFGSCVLKHGLDPDHWLDHLLSAPGLAWQETLKKTKVKLDLLTDVDMLNKKFKTSIKSRISIETNAIKFNQEAWLKPFI